MSKSKNLIKALLFLCMLVMSAVPAVAQVAGPDKPVAGSTPGGVNSGSSSDAELWRQIRKGSPGTVAGGNKSGGMMIQSGGQDWRLIRNGPLPKYAAWAILGMLLLLSVFFALRGRIKIGHGRSGTTMKRFSLTERVGHWLLASSFILLALTGLNLVFGKGLLIPLFGKEAFANITAFGKFIHNYVGFAFMLGLIMITVMWVLHNIPNLHDLKWLLRGGGIIGGGHPPAKKFNAGQKIIFWVVVLCGISISMSGWALMNPFTTNMFSGTFSLMNDWFGTNYATDLAPIQEQQYQSIWHTIMAVFMIVVVLAHIYIGTVGMEGALPAMTSGNVDTNWAREHHSLWVEEQEVGGMVPATTSLSKDAVSASAAVGIGAAVVASSAKSTKADSTAARATSPVPPKLPEPPKFASKTKRKVTIKASTPKSTAKKKVTAKPTTATKPKAAAKPKVTAKAKTTTSKSVAKRKAVKSATKTASTSRRKTPKELALAKAASERSVTQKVSRPKSATKPKPKTTAKPKVKTAAKPKAKTVVKPKARTVAKTTAKPRAGTKSTVRDDLKLIKGVGSQNEKKLNAIGVRRFADVAKWTKKQQSDIGDRLAFPGRIEREEWVKQAKALAKGSKRS